MDTSTAVLVLQTASQLFSRFANTAFTPTTVTYQSLGQGYWQFRLPFRPVISIQAVRIISSYSGTQTLASTDYTRVKMVLYRLIGFGVPGMFPPDLIEVDLTHGYATVPDDVKGAVLETAAAAYQSPDTTLVSESIDDYAMKTSGGGMVLSQGAMDLAKRYRGTFVS